MNQQQERLKLFRKQCGQNPDGHFIVDEGWEYVILDDSCLCTYNEESGQTVTWWSHSAVRWLYEGDVSVLGITPAQVEYGIKAYWQDDTGCVVVIGVRLEETIQVGPSEIEQVMRRCINAGFNGAGFHGYDLKQIRESGQVVVSIQELDK